MRRRERRRVGLGRRGRWDRFPIPSPIHGINRLDQRVKSMHLAKSALKPPPQKEALKQVAALLGTAVIGRPAKPSFLAKGGVADARILAGNWTFLVRWKSSGDAAAVGSALRQLRHHQGSAGQDVLAVLAVPFMGETGQCACEDAGVSWLDLAGNAHLDAPGLRIHVRGHPNPFKRKGRPSSPFAPKSSRISRWLLMHPNEFVAQRELAEQTEVGEGFTSRIVHRLEEKELIDRNEAGAVRARDPDLLLDAWAEDYDFDVNYFLRGHIAVRSGEDLLQRIPRAPSKGRQRYVATGLAGAWLLTGFAAFGVATFYVSSFPSAQTLRRIGFREVERGANLWWVVPKDDGVFHGAGEIQGFECVHPVQTWLDLQGHPERAQEAADSLRKKLLRWNSRRV